MSNEAQIVMWLCLGVVCLRFVWDVLKHGWGTPEPRTRMGMEARGRSLGGCLLFGVGAVVFGLYLFWYYTMYGSLK